MGKRGPPRKPTAAKKRDGTYRKDRAPAGELELDAAIPPRPDYLDEHGRECWDYFAPQLVELGLLTDMDWAAFVTFCQAWARKRSCEEVLAEKGLTFRTPKGYVQQRPEVSIMMQSEATYIKLFSHFGLSPSTRAGLEVGDRGSGGDEDEAFLFGRRGPELVKDEGRKGKAKGRRKVRASG